jgi:hypothetical protein
MLATASEMIIAGIHERSPFFGLGQAFASPGERVEEFIMFSANLVRRIILQLHFDDVPRSAVSTIHERVKPLEFLTEVGGGEE